MNYPSLLLALWLVGSSGFADTIHDWFDATHKAPNQQLADLALKSVQAQGDMASAALYPKFTALASLERFSSPTNLSPLPPTEMAQISASGGGYPFSETITSIGSTSHGIPPSTLINVSVVNSVLSPAVKVSTRWVK